MENYKTLVNNIGAYLKNTGWIKKKDTFYILINNNFGLIHFQKSKSSNKEELLFTINLGISSAIIREFEGDDVNLKPEIESCHWKKRVGFLLNQNEDKWWKVLPHTNIDILTTEILNILSSMAIPVIKKNITDSDLKNSWLNGNAEGLTEFQMLLNLVILLKNYKSDELPLFIDKLLEYSKNKPIESTAKFYVNKLKN